MERARIEQFFGENRGRKRFWGAVGLVQMAVECYLQDSQKMKEDTGKWGSFALWLEKEELLKFNYIKWLEMIEDEREVAVADVVYKMEETCEPIEMLECIMKQIETKERYEKNTLKTIEEELSNAIYEVSVGSIKSEWCRWIAERNAPTIYIYGYNGRTLEEYAKAVMVDFIRTNIPDVPDKNQLYGPDLEMEYDIRQREKAQKKEGKE